MSESFAYDRVLRDLFQTDHPSLFEHLTGGRRVREFLNVQFPKTLERRAQLLMKLQVLRQMCGTGHCVCVQQVTQRFVGATSQLLKNMS